MNSVDSTLSKSSIAIVADSDTVTGFRLGGIKEVHAIEDMEGAKKIIKDLTDQGFSIIITTEKIGDGIREFIDRITKNRTLPIIVEVPDKTGPIKRATDPIKELVKRAIGIETVK
ncbi:MAG: V-type ATP synthase subunit F [Euryarchaeota archaeon]|nr:V-type ATP synthase subunit F [Euryarchaeota archaeon]